METPPWDIKNKKSNKIRTSALSNSSMEICWKRKKGGEKERYVRKGNTGQLSVRNFANIFLGFALKHCYMVTVLRVWGVVDTTTACSDICEHLDQSRQDAATVHPRAGIKPPKSLGHASTRPCAPWGTRAVGRGGNEGRFPQATFLVAEGRRGRERVQSRSNSI